MKTVNTRGARAVASLLWLLACCGDDGGESASEDVTSGSMTASSDDPSATGTSDASAGTGAGTGTGASTGTDASTGEDTTAGAEADLLEDDFESAPVGGPPDASLWTMALVGSNGTITIDDSTAHSGAQSVHVHHEGFSTFMAAEGVFPTPDNSFFGRVWFRLDAGLPQGHVTWIEAGVQANDVDEARIGANLGQMDVNHWPGDEEQRADVAVQAQTWHCLEFEFNGAAHEIRVWFEGQEVPGLHVTDWTTPPGGDGNNQNPLIDWAPEFESVRFGWELGGGDIWFDDIALATARLGC